MSLAIVTPTVTRPVRDWMRAMQLRRRLRNLERDIEGAEQDVTAINLQNDQRRDYARVLRAQLREMGVL
jgi:hypothetical protein